MCGITGYFDRSGRAKESASDLENALAALRHRGPNDQGSWQLDPGMGLGHTRLSILDLSSHGHQPMVSENGQFVMAFNGEIYNFADIRKDLEPLGHNFKGTGDSEVILAAFCEWGLKAVDRFIGMFAIALWNRSENRLYLLRDRLGVKPLYYSWDGSFLCFGSELKALRAFNSWKVEIDKSALAEYFQFGYINAPRSIYKNVFKLSPGHWLEIGLEGEPITKRYWSVLDALANPLKGSEEQLAAELEALMVDAFRLRMVSDVPVGVFLSGGIDSSMVAAILQKNAAQPIHTFTIGFNEARVNESVHAKRVADYLGTVHSERILETSEAKAILPNWGQLYDEPFFDSSGIPTYLVSKMAGEEVKVVLSADGGDELFSGYNGYTGVLNHLDKRAQIPDFLLKLLRGVLPHLPLDAIDHAINYSPLPMGMRQWLRSKLSWRACRIRDYVCPTSPGAFYEQALAIWKTDELDQLVGGYTPVREKLDAYPGNVAEQLCLWDIHNYLPGDILAKVDRATMAVSIEGREPLLDHRIVEFAFRLPLHMRRGELGNKHLLRKVLYKYVPRELIDRPKQGFGIPLLEWLRGDLSYLIKDYLDPDKVREQGILDPEMVRCTVQGFQRGDNYALNKVWTLLAFQMWRERWH